MVTASGGLGLPPRRKAGFGHEASPSGHWLGPLSVHRAPKTPGFEQVLKAGESQNILFFLGHELFADRNICVFGCMS